MSITQEAFAARVGMATPNYQRIERGGQNLTLRLIERIATELDTTVYALIAAAATWEPAKAVSPGKRTSRLHPLRAAGYQVREATARGRRQGNAVPVMTLRAAAGTLGGEARVVEALGWISLPRASPAPAGQFVAQIEGDSMEPRIPNGAFCLFGPPAPPPYRGRIVLVEHPTLDEELGGPFAVKAIEVRTAGGTKRVTLRSRNPDYPPLVIDTATDGDVRVIADFIEVLAPKPRPRATRGKT